MIFDDRKRSVSISAGGGAHRHLRTHPTACTRTARYDAHTCALHVRAWRRLPASPRGLAGRDCTPSHARASVVERARTHCTAHAGGRTRTHTHAHALHTATCHTACTTSRHFTHAAHCTCLRHVGVKCSIDDGRYRTNIRMGREASGICDETSEKTSVKGWCHR